MSHKKIARLFRRNPLSRCGICGRKPINHNQAAHIIKEKIRV